MTAVGRLSKNAFARDRKARAATGSLPWYGSGASSLTSESGMEPDMVEDWEDWAGTVTCATVCTGCATCGVG